MTSVNHEAHLALAKEAKDFDPNEYGSSRRAMAQAMCLLEDCAHAIADLNAENARLRAAHGITHPTGD